MNFSGVIGRVGPSEKKRSNFGVIWIRIEQFFTLQNRGLLISVADYHV